MAQKPKATSMEQAVQKQEYYLPEFGVTVEASSLEEAGTLARQESEKPKQES